MNAIITYFPEFRQQAVKEIAVCGGKVIKRFADHISLVASGAEVQDTLSKLSASKPVFIRHIMPVLAEGDAPLDKNETCMQILAAAESFCTLQAGDRFAVQCRVIASEAEWNAKDIEVCVGSHYDNLGSIPVFADHQIINEDIFIISVFVYKERFYAGFSKASQNLSSHSDEYRILSRKGREISRAENKLKEAINTFRIQVTGKGRALDIGAAPGGWTKVLADYGFDVSAVDPGDLHESLRAHPRITHYKARIETLKFDDPFEIIVNDMNVDPQITAEIMNSLSPLLAQNGLAVVTLKLPFFDVERSISESLAILEPHYALLYLRSLSHNRREITALIQKR